MAIEKKRKRADPVKQEKPKVTTTSTTSLLKADEAFPRGGGSVLTPFEYKEATNEAKRDALFEESAAKSDKKSKKRKSDSAGQHTSVKDGPRIEGLSYKRLTAGTVVLGQVAAINSLDLVVSLPNNLSGFVAITNISAALSKRLEQDEESSSEDDKDRATPEPLPELSELFEIGQWLRATVISTAGPNKERAGQKLKKRIDLSIEPALTNKGLQASYIQNRALLQASVKSVEDHGIVMDTGVAACTGFIKTKEFGARNFRIGQTLLCSVTGAEGDRRVIQLSADLRKDAKRLKLKSVVNVDAVLPGDGVEVLITEAHQTAFSGRILGLLDATCDTFQAGTLSQNDVKFKAGDKILGRVMFTDPQAEPRKVAVSLLQHVIDFSSVSASLATEQHPTEATPIGFVLDNVAVKHVEPHVGLFCETNVNGILGFVHISRVSDGKVENLSSNSGRYKIGSQHSARVVGYNSVDGMFLLSMEQKIIDTKYLNVNDIPIGEILPGTVEKFVPGGVLIKISEGMTGLVPDNHIADVKLTVPEKKFKAGLAVQCRVLDTDALRRRVILTMKKSLVNSEVPIISSFDNVEIGTKAIGVISKLFDNGALIQFYGGVHGFLPSSHMSEAYIANPREHFKIGQTLSVTIIKLDVADQKMTLSCRDSSAWDGDKQVEFENFVIGTVCSATITEKTADRLVLSLIPSGLAATLDVGHMADADFPRCDKLFQKARVGGHLKEVLVLEKHESQRQLVLSMKSSLIAEARASALPMSFESLQVGQKVRGFVRKAMDYGVLIGFANGLTGLALKHNLSNDYVSMPASIYSVAQSVSCTVIEVDNEQRRFQVSLKDTAGVTSSTSASTSEAVVNPVDPTIKLVSDLLPGRVLMARITAIKETQLNIALSENIQGRIDVSSIFEDFDNIQSKKHPLKQFSVDQEIKVKIVGYHDAKNHKFLPLSHRQKNTKTIFECSARPSDLANSASVMLDFKDIKEGSIHTAFVNNLGIDCLWVSISPIVRGRINILDLETDVKSIAAIQQTYSIGSAVSCRVIKYTSSTKHLDLSERAVNHDAITSMESVKVGDHLPARITRVADSGLLAQISDTISGKISLTDISSCFKDKPTAQFEKNQLIHVTVKSVDIPNKKIALSLRDSEAGSDPEINSVEDLSVGQAIRGYIKNVADQGLFVELGRDVVGRVKIGEVSDAFIKDWKTGFSVDQLVSGKVIAIDARNKRVELTLKKNAKFQEKHSGLTDLQVGQVVEGTIKKIESFGVFIQVTAVAGVSGLCHKSEIADKPIKDIAAVYSVGDVVKAKVLDINIEKRRISFGLKSSYFNATTDAGTEEDDSDMQDAEEDNDELDEDEGTDEDNENDSDDEGDDSQDEDMEESEDEAMSDAEESQSARASQSIRSGFDINPFTDSVFEDAPIRADESDTDADQQPKKKAKKSKKSYDDSGSDLQHKKPQSVPDFERLILGQPDSSFVWINFMAYYMELSDFEAARAVAERALKTINYRLEDEKLNIWMALLNLENTYNEGALDAIFKRSCTFNDPLEMHSRLVGIFIRSQKFDRAIETYNTMIEQFKQSTKTWIEYATFLASQDKWDEARDLLPRALSSLQKTEHISVLTKFACLEFKKGDAERGRTLFEGLLSSYPKRLDLWNVLIDMEATQASSQTTVRELFDRVLSTKLSMKKAKSMFKKWLQYEKDHGAEDDVERVKARAVEYVEAH